MDLGYAFMLLGGVSSPPPSGDPGGDRPAHGDDDEAPPSREMPSEPPEREPSRTPTSPGLGDPRSPDANPIDPRVFETGESR